MKISNTFPPNYDVMVRAFPNCEKQKAVFCYGDTLFNPFGATVTKDLEVHEQVHSEQQAVYGVDLWYEKYIKDDKFRMGQELEAYAHQWLFVKRNAPDDGLPEWLLDKCAEALASELYKLNLTSNEARCKIKRRARTLSDIF